MLVCLLYLLLQYYYRLTYASHNATEIYDNNQNKEITYVLIFCMAVIVVIMIMLYLGINNRLHAPFNYYQYYRIP